MKFLESIPIFSYGFRPFFLAAGIWAATAMLIWIGMLTGAVSVNSPYGALIWHAHELLFGYVPAVVAGFILTAIPNWTGREPVQGTELLILVLVWICGRVAIGIADDIGLVLAAITDCLFLPVLTVIAARETIAAGNFRNLKIVIIFALLATCNIGFHIEILMHGYPFYSIRAAVSIIVTLVMLIGGRIIPNFTRNWLIAHNYESLPIQFNRYDGVAIVLSVLALALWTAFPVAIGSGFVLFVAAILQGIRLARWSGFQTLSEPLVFVLHLGYFFVPVGFAAVGISAIWPEFISTGGALHAWTSGAIGIMTLAVMTRAIRGHTDRPLTAPIGTQMIYFFVIMATLARMTSAFIPGSTNTLLLVASLAWVAAFGCFVVNYASMLILRAPRS